MNFYIMTLFPEMVMDGLNTSIIGRAVNKGLLSIEALNIRIMRSISITAWMTIRMEAVQGC